ncbi:MAG: zf-HC2 domain-containing protein [Lautropia sp.]|nr:zf-HC2 domain-containing protein [Lautropia sp.]
MKPPAPAHSKCLRVTRLISAAQDQDESLSLTDRLIMRLHLSICPHCRRFRRNTRTLHQVMKHYSDPDICATPASASQGDGTVDTSTKQP